MKPILEGVGVGRRHDVSNDAPVVRLHHERQLGIVGDVWQDEQVRPDVVVLQDSGGIAARRGGEQTDLSEGRLVTRCEGPDPWHGPEVTGLRRLVPLLVLLPPSQSKASPERGRRVGLSTLAYPRLREPRERLIDAVDRGLRTAPAIPAADLYTGVLFGALGLADLPWDGVLIASALWGVVRPGDRIPAYRLDMSAKPAGVGGLAAYWREPLRAALPDRGLVLDLRSGSYVAAWKPRRANHLVVRGFTETADGSRTVVTHMAKRVRGELARLVLQAGRVERPEEVAEIATAGGMRVELSPGVLDVVESPR